MSYPTLEQYNEALQHPQLALVDPELKRGSVKTTGLGLPLALCGGFALTYTLQAGSAKYAVRCFHKHSLALEQRYRSISSRLKASNSPYFVNFEFQPHGVNVMGKVYPIVKMAWASGTTLGEFLERHHRSPDHLQRLSASLRALSRYLESQNMAHGDIQPGNVMVANDGGNVQLIDYDGMFVEDLKSLGSAELGHRNFQHPKRSGQAWNSTIDRFSFIGLHLALRALETYPDLWKKTQSDGDAILFKANDFATPSSSAIFNELLNRPQFTEDAKNFAAICEANFEKTPPLEDFLAGKNIPVRIVPPKTSITTARARYIPAFEVLDAQNYALCHQHIGEKVELIGRIAEIKKDVTRHKKPYIFINFGPWKGDIVKLSIWSEGLAALTNEPDQSWIGKWVSVVGLMDPPYRNKRLRYSHLSINITQSNQLHVISEDEAKFRLAAFSNDSGSFQSGNTKTSKIDNKEVLNNIRQSTSATPPLQAVPPPKTGNQAILQQMKGSRPSSTTPPPASAAKPAATPSPLPFKSAASGKNQSRSSSCFIATAVYGPNAPETEVLRQWRDRVLLPRSIGRALVALYYKFSPKLIPIIERSPHLKNSVRRLLDPLVRLIQPR